MTRSDIISTSPDQIEEMSDDDLANMIKSLSASRQRVVAEALPLINLRAVSEIINTTYQTTKVLRYRRENDRDSYPAPDRLPPDIATGTGAALYLRSEVQEWGVKCGRIIV